MDFSVPDRVHIMPVGYEKDRIFLSALNFKADRVVLIGHVDDQEEDVARLDELEEQLEDHQIEVERAVCDIFDLYDALGLIGELIMTFEEDDVYVNVSTGSKVTAIAGMIACMAIDATPYYAKAKDYSGEFPEELEFVEQLPRYPIDAPERQQVEMLYVISEIEEQAEATATKGDLIHVGEHLGMPFITEKDVQDKGQYRALDKEILDPLKEDGHITVNPEGRSKVVSITEEGKNALRAFNYLVRDSQKELVKEIIESGRIK